MMAGTPIAPTAAAQPSFRVGDERLIKLTANAAKKVSTLLTKQGRPAGVLRVAVIGGGCSGLQYGMVFDEKRDNDHAAECFGVAVLVDPFSADYLRGTTIDFSDSLTGGGFKILNPNAKESCGCGKSFTA